MKRLYIKEDKKWDKIRLRSACIRHNLFTCGTNEEYHEALEYVETNVPNLENVYTLSQYLCDHSYKKDLASIMYIIINEVIKTYIDISDEPGNHTLEVATYKFNQ